jgi:lipoyl(octanoyl) transferase
MLFERLIVIHDPAPHRAALNMAIDEALLADAPGPALRLYRWERPAVSFGYFGRIAAIEAAWPGRELVRRMTGGGAVPHGADLTYSIIVPAADPFAHRIPREIYRAVHESVARALRSSGVMPVLAAGSAAAGTGVCFESPVEFDLLAGGRKVAGAAMKRTRGGLLIQGSVQEVPGLDRIRESFADAFGTRVVAADLSSGVMSAAESLAQTKYGASEWTARH